MELIASMVFMCCCLFLPMLLDSLSVKEKIVIKKEVVEVIKYLPQPQIIPKNPMKDDAIKCLVSLGLKKSEATKKVNEMFEKIDYQSIESFLLDVYKV